MLELFTYFRSSASFRVRIALNFKGLEYQPQWIHLVKDGGQQHQKSYQDINPQKLVPTLKDGPHVISQSLAIIEYLEEKYPHSSLLPGSASQRAQIRSLSHFIACEIQPLSNLRVQHYLTEHHHWNEAQKKDWLHHWFNEGFKILERQVQPTDQKPYCCGQQFTMADACLVPQLTTALRYGCDLSNVPKLKDMYEALMELPFVAKAAPNAQPDAEN